MKIIAIPILIFPFVISCSNPQPGPDKTASGIISGGAVGAGAGAVIGHQLGYAGEGAGLGGAFGAVAGALSGVAYDLNDSALGKQKEELAALHAQNNANAEELGMLQRNLDQIASEAKFNGVYQVYFDTDQTDLRGGSTAALETVAEAIKKDPGARKVYVDGHSDDTGQPEYNERLAEARARSVAGYLASRGISTDQIEIRNFGSKRPISSNATPTGRQFNRRVEVHVEG